MAKRRSKRRPNRLGSPLGLHETPNRPLPKSGQSVRATSRPIPPTPTGRWMRFNPFRRRFSFSWRKLGISVLVLFGVCVLGATAVFAYYVRQLPNPKKIETPPVQSTKILDRNGKELYSIHGEQNRTVVTGDQIAPYLKEATIAIEDQNFYHHHGFDIRGIARAALVHLHLLNRDLSGGGSTITQQYIKNTLPGFEAETLSRKVKELILSVEVEQIYTKDEILTGYLNQIPYGNNAYGIEAASQLYFGKHAKDLTLSEAATLAAIPNAPTYYSPYGNHLDRLFVRKNYILDQMVKTGAITKAQAEQAKQQAPDPNDLTFQKQGDLIAPHFVFYVREQLIQTLDPDPQKAEKMLDTGGYVVTTSLDLDTQAMAEKVVSDMGPSTIKKYNATNASLTAVDPKTGEVLAMVGSIDYNNSKSGNTNFADALLQPGSSFKPIVYATAFGPGNKYSPSSTLYDVPTDFGNYTPSDYDGKTRGPISIRQALAGSLNIPAVKMLYLAGVKQSLDTAKSMGITTLNRPPSDYGLSLVLGSGEVKPVEMANAYATFADGGIHHDLRPILTIAQNGHVIKDYTQDGGKKVLEPDVAYEISSILSDNNARSYVFGTRNSLTLPDRPVAAKTGTTENFRDGWTIGYTPSIAVAVWVGNNDPNKTMTKGTDGVVVAAPIWQKFMMDYLKGKPVEQFTRPADIKEVTVDKLSGKLPTDQSPPDQQITDIFAPWQVPKDPDDVHVKVKIDKVSGKLATALTPAQDVIEQTFFTVHSEAPDKPGWEQPVQDWAKANGGGTPPPTESDDVHTAENAPTISITSPTDGGSVAGTFTISADPGGAQPVSKVDFVVDGSLVATVTQAPWQTSYNGSGLAPGSHIIQATVTNAIDMTQTTQVTVTLNKDSTPPANVTSASASDGAKSISGTGTNKPIKLTWNNPSNSDLASVNVYESLTSDPNDLGTKVQTVPATADSIDSVSIDVASLSSGKTYYFILRPVDTSGNENQSATKLSAKVQPIP